MKIQYKAQKIEIQKPEKISKLFEQEIKESRYPILAAKFNNEYMNLENEITEDGNIELIDNSSKEGMKVYRRTLIYVVGKAFERLYPNKKMEVNYQLGNSMFCDLVGEEVTEEFTEELEAEVRKIVKENLPIKQIVMNRKQAEEFFESAWSIFSIFSLLKCFNIIFSRRS